MIDCNYIKKDNRFILAIGGKVIDYLPLPVYKVEFSANINGEEKIVYRINENFQFVIKNFNGKCKVISRAFGPVYEIYYMNKEDAKAAAEWLNAAFCMEKISN